MIYFVQYSNRKPQRIAEDHAHDFYQMWHGNTIGQTNFDSGEQVTCPNFPQLSLWGEDFKESTWFKKILQGEYDEGYFEIDGIL